MSAAVLLLAAVLAAEAWIASGPWAFGLDFTRFERAALAFGLAAPFLALAAGIHLLGW